MTLTVKLRDLDDEPAYFRAEDVAPATLDLDTHDEMLQAESLSYELEVQKSDEGLLVTGDISVQLNCHCVRCLKSFKILHELPGYACEIPMEGEEKVSIDNNSADLTPFVREDILLGLPQHPLCRTDCRGLLQKPPGKASLSEGKGRTEKTSSAWSELNKLKFEEE